MGHFESGNLAFADGRVFACNVMFPDANEASLVCGEAVFTTGMTGYQEVLTDPSYAGQCVLLTSPHIGNTGINSEDMESRQCFLSALLINQLSDVPSNWRSEKSLSTFLNEQGIPVARDLDTRAVAEHIRDVGAQNIALGSAASHSNDALVKAANAFPSMSGRDMVKVVSTKSAFTLGAKNKHRVVCLDFGIKQNILRHLVDANCEVHVVPATTSAAEIIALTPDGVFLSNGPGDPAAVTYAVETVKQLLGTIPIFGICLGHQLLALAAGGSTYKMKFGHRGLNQPVRNESTRKIEITAQNHGFAVDTGSLPENVTTTHIHLNDGTSEGIRIRDKQAFSVQFHPESAAGPHDSHYLFDEFLSMMRSAAVES